MKPIGSILRGHLNPAPEPWCKSILLYSPSNAGDSPEDRVMLYALAPPSQPASETALPAHPPAEAVHEGYPHEDMDALAADRYKVRPTKSGFWGFEVVAGDGDQQLYKGHKRDCDVVARRLRGAFLDGGFAATKLCAPTATLTDAQCDAIHHALGGLSMLELSADRIADGRRQIRDAIASHVAQPAVQPEPATLPAQAWLTEDDVGMTRISDGCYVCGGNPRPKIVPKGKFLCCEKCGGGYGEVS